MHDLRWAVRSLRKQPGFTALAMLTLALGVGLVSAQLARGLARQREVAVRAALGASRGRLIKLLFAETALLVLAGSALGAGVRSSSERCPT